VERGICLQLPLLKGSCSENYTRLFSEVDKKGEMGNKQKLHARNVPLDRRPNMFCSPGTGARSGCSWTRPEQMDLALKLALL